MDSRKNEYGCNLGKALFVVVLAIAAAVTVLGGQQGQTEGIAGQTAKVEANDANNVKDVNIVSSAAEASNSADESNLPKLETEAEAEAEVLEASPDMAIQSLKLNKDMSIRDALRFLAAKYHKNIIPSAKVDGKIPVTTLYDVTFEEALNAILGYSFKYEQQGNFINVYAAEEYKKFKQDTSRMTYKVFTLYYVTAPEALKLVSPVLSVAGKIEASTASKSGISTDATGISSEAGGDSVAFNDCIVVYDFPEKIAEIEQLVRQIDVKPQQVLVEATILSATLTEETSLGIDFSTLNGVAINTIENIGAGIAGIATGGFASAIEDGGLSVGITSDHVAVFIRALESITDITILANPKILALNKQVGTVFIGQKLGYRDRTTISDTGQATIGEVKFLDTGTKLSFRPYVANDGYIRMDIYPKDSSGELDEAGIPTETTAELVTNIMVRDNQTIVIGGLFRDSVTATRSQVPLIGDIPIIGAAFKGTTDTNKRQEIIVLLTPHIIQRVEDTRPDARIEDMNRKRFGARKAMQGYSIARIAEDHYAKAIKYYSGGNTAAALCELDAALQLRSTYLEAIRLKEKIIRQISPDDAARIERIMVGIVEREESENWVRR